MFHPPASDGEASDAVAGSNLHRSAHPAQLENQLKLNISTVIQSSACHCICLGVCTKSPYNVLNVCCTRLKTAETGCAIGFHDNKNAPHCFAHTQKGVRLLEAAGPLGSALVNSDSTVV